MKFILIAAALAIVAFFVAKKLKAKKEVVAPKKVTPTAPKKKTNTVKPSTSLTESDSDGNDYYRKPRKAQQ